MQKVLILGHKGMLGNAVFKYFTEQKDSFTVITTKERWPTDTFKDELIISGAGVIINCIGSIPQKKPSREEYKLINNDLPLFLETLGKKIIHPSTDCEFSGTLETGKKYTTADTRDASDEYGKSKAGISEHIEKEFINTKIIRTSIIGHEENTSLSLLDWFLHSSNEVNGYTNHYWNGITTLEWAKLCKELIINWSIFPRLNQYGTKEIRSKYDLLNDIKTIYDKNIKIIPFKASETVNKCLESDREIKSISILLQEMKEFYTEVPMGNSMTSV